MRDEVQLNTWLDGLEQRLEQMAAGYNEASFDKYIGQPTSDLNQYDAAFAALWSEPSYQTTVKDWLPRSTDPVLKRRLMVFQNSFLEAEISTNPTIYELRNSINERIIAFQPSLNGQKLGRSEITEILRTHPERAYRRQVFEQALRPLAEQLGPGVRELMRRRNAQAQKLGYPTYPDLQLKLLGLSRLTLYSLFDQLEQLTNAPYQAFLAESCQKAGLKQLEQWDLNFFADQEANLPPALFPCTEIIPAIFAFLRCFGLEPEKLPVQVITKDIPFGGLCYSISIPNDIRILCNPKDGYAYYRTMFHEFGHALHAVFNRQQSYILKRESGVFNEAMAETLAYFTQQSEWLIETSGLPAAQIEGYQRGNLARRLVRFRSLMAQAHFEIEAYSQLEANLEQLNAEMETRYLLTPNLTPRWAASSFPTTHPIYRQNYILAELIAAQTHATLRQKFGSFWQLDSEGQAAVFAFLVENYYAPGNRYDWLEKVQQATGQNLQVSALAQDLML